MKSPATGTPRPNLNIKLVVGAFPEVNASSVQPRYSGALACKDHQIHYCMSINGWMQWTGFGALMAYNMFPY